MRLKLLLFLSSIIFITGCKKGGTDPVPSLEESIPAKEYPSDILNAYADLQVIMINNTPGYSSPVAARTLAYLALANYEAAVNGMEEYESMVGKLENFNAVPQKEEGEKYHWLIVSNAAQSTLMKQLFATSGDVFRSKIDTLKKQIDNKYKNGLGPENLDRSIRFGNEIGMAIFNYSKTDGGHDAWNNNFPLKNSALTGNGKWEPTGAEKRPLLPQWQKVRTFLKSNSDWSQSSMPEFSFKNYSDFFKLALALYNKKEEPTFEQKAMMSFWKQKEENATMAGQQLLLLNSIMAREKLNFEDASVLLLKTSLAMHDAYTASYRNKYNFNIMRPVTYINQAIDPHWKPLESNITPCPDYTSEQVALISAFSAVLENKLGKEYIFEDYILGESINRRPYKSFEEYKSEIITTQSLSQTYFAPSITDGEKQGKKIGESYAAMNLKKAATN